MIEVGICLLLIFIILNLLVLQFPINNISKSNEKILILLQEVIDSTNKELPPTQPDAKLTKLDEEDKDEEESLQDKINSPITSIWEEDSLSAEEVERL